MDFSNILLATHKNCIDGAACDILFLMNGGREENLYYSGADHEKTAELMEYLLTKDKPIIFAYHGYPWLIHRLTYRRSNHKNIHVRGYKEEGTTSTPFDMVVRNDLDRFHLVEDVIDRVPKLGYNKLIEHKEYIAKYGIDKPEITEWTWNGKKKRKGTAKKGR